MLKKLKNNFKSNKFLTLVLALSLSLNIIGIYPNTLLHQDEPGLLAPSKQMFENVIFNFNPDPNVEPFPFKYGSSMYYIYGLFYGVMVIIVFVIDFVTTVFNPSLGLSNFYHYVTQDISYRHSELTLIAPRLLTALFGTATVFLTYKTALKLLNNRTVALISAFALSVLPLQTRDSHYATVDIPQSFFMLLAYYYSIDIWKKKTLKSYLIAAFLVGYSTSIKYFPLAVTTFLYFHFLNYKTGLVNKQLIISMPFFFIGYIFGMPYIFVHFSKIINQFKEIMGWFTSTEIKNDTSFIEKLIPPYFHLYPFKFMFLKAILPIPSFLVLYGLIYTITRKSLSEISLIVIPLFNLVFITFFQRQEYERLVIPMLPYMSILIGISIFHLFSKFHSKLHLSAVFAIAILLIFTTFHPIYNSFSASFACSSDIPEHQARKFIATDLPKKKVFAFHPGMRLPDAEFTWVESTFENNFNLSELYERGAEMLATDTGYTDQFLIWDKDFILLPQTVIKNQFVTQSINEIRQNSKLIANFSKPYMCQANNVHIYALTKKINPEKDNLIFVTNFNKPEELKKWNITHHDKFSVTRVSWEKSLGFQTAGSLKYLYAQPEDKTFREDNRFSFTDELSSDYIDAKAETKYSVYAYVKTLFETGISGRDGYIKINYYDVDKNLIKTSLSSRVSKKGWEELKAASISPKETRFVTIGFQGTGDHKEAAFLLDNVRLYSKK